MSPRTELPRDKLIELAEKTLSLASASSSQIPEGYLDELRKHVKFSKDDTFFRVIPHIGRGFGIVICLEKGCNGLIIDLGKRTSTQDDGKGDGIGSLSAYRVHVQNHPTHKASRFARIKAESEGTLSGTTGKITPSGPSNVPVFNNHIASMWRSRPASSSSTSKSSAQFALEPKTDGFSTGSSSPLSSMFRSQKRNCAHMDDEDTDITIPSSSPYRQREFPVKKLKFENVKAKVLPLSPKDLNARNQSQLPPHVARAQFVKTKEATQATDIRRYLGNERMTAGDIQRMNEIEAQLKNLRERTNIQAALPHPYTLGKSPSTAPQNTAVVKQAPYEGNVKPFGQQTVASATNVYNPAYIPPVALASNAQLLAAPAVTKVDGLLGLNASVLPVLPERALPNYGDTVDYEDESDSFNSRFKGHVPAGPLANPGEIEQFLAHAGNSELFDGNESVDKALETIGLKKLGEHLPQMSIALMPHQVIGVAWMKEHERGIHKGGILADDMGLGKTIAAMELNRSDDPAVKSTLICAPVALLDQWKLEIETKTECALKCLIYHGSNKPKKKTEIQKYDVVLTTYHTLALEYHDPRVSKRKKNKKRRSNDSDDFIESESEPEQKDKIKKGLLLRLSWYRVILDEAQNIRNRNTRISIAVTNVDAKYRWCLTGTPVTNSLADCYGLIRFLRIRPWYDWDHFNGHIARIERRSPDLASKRMQAILATCLLRRKKDSLLDGKKLIELPPKQLIQTQLEFSKEERDIYSAIEARSQAVFNKYLRAGTVLKNYAHVLVLLLRLRQLCSHPCLIQEDGFAYVRSEDDPAVKVEMRNELDRAATLAGKDFVERMKEKFKAIMCQRMAAEKESAEAVIEEECPVCFDNLTNPLVTRCGHVFCADCIQNVLSQAPVEHGNELRKEISGWPCPACQEPVHQEMLFQRAAFEPTEEVGCEHSGETSSPNAVDYDESEEDGLPIGSDVLPVAKGGKRSGPTSTSASSRGKSKRRFSRRFLDSDDDDDDGDDDLSDFIVQSDEDEEDAPRRLKRNLRKNKRVVPDSEEDDDELLPPTVIAKKRGQIKKLEHFLPSTKMKEMMNLLKKWAETEESRNEKTMVLSQWTSCLDLVADYLRENGFTFVRYQGDMNRHARDEAVRTFMSQGKARIMLMSLKCGGVGLNLTRANRVISLDLGWSSAVESQAFDRVHRLGQIRPVTVHKLVIENTVEARILALQERKQNLADGSLGEGTGKKLGRLSVKDLANLFGLDARGEVL